MNVNVNPTQNATEPRINGQPWKLLHGHMAYIVTMKGGPADGLKNIACNTRSIFFAGHRYCLNDSGDFVYSPQSEQAATPSL